MPRIKKIEVTHLHLDLDNYRTTSQDTEMNAIKAMIATNPSYFYGVFESILDDGFLPLENIIVQEQDGKCIVKEGNRRIASLKICHGIYDAESLGFSKAHVIKISNLSIGWKRKNLAVTCSVYADNEETEVNRIVSLIHAKGQKAGRYPWEAIAKARYNRDVNEKREPGLEVLEVFLKNTPRLSEDEKYKWSGTYPVTVLDEALKKIAPMVGIVNAPTLALEYPKVSKIVEIDKVIYDIGVGTFKFKTIRSNDPDFLISYGIISKSSDSENSSNDTSSSSAGNKTNSGSTKDGKSSHNPTSPSGATDTSSTGSTPSAFANTNLRHVQELLRGFMPLGKNREKVVSLRDEMLKLNVKQTPIAFCFLLRSIFEISAKAYCKDHSLVSKSKDGRDLPLVDILRNCVNHMTANQSKNSPLVKELHGALTEMAKKDGILSVTSMNQLVHNPIFSIIPTDIAILFGNIFPLLHKLN